MPIALPGLTGNAALDAFVVLAIVGAGLGGLAAIYKYAKQLVQWVTRGVRRVDGFLEEWGRLSKLLPALEELRPNGGSSLRDQVNRIDARGESVEQRLSTVETKVDEKIAADEAKLSHYLQALRRQGIDLTDEE